MDLSMLLPDLPEKRDGWRWATVTQVSPVRVCLDGDTAPLLITPDVLGSVTVGQRVYCHRNGHRLVVLPMPSTGAWAPYTPTLQNVSLGNGTLGGSWTQVGRTVHYRASLTFGSTTTISSLAIVGVPRGFVSAGQILGHGLAADASAGSAGRMLMVRPWSTATGGLYLADGAAVAPGSPWTWAEGDVLQWSGTYETGP